ncbi:hypothetical protein [Maricaulis sp.]|uniref:hypothetical protein n=1 Tax=Maricaulis sp. TaxID=1486257 RepID=UPI002B27836E|nr:hypothetical protein [Maricaulis sp.]
MTLLETMVALAVLALSTSLVTMTLLPRQSEQVLDKATEHLMLDLQAAGAEARMTGHAVELIVLERGYRIPALNRDVEWGESVGARWRVATPDGWTTRSRLAVTGPSLAALETHIELTLGDQTRTVRVEALTAHISHD